MLVERGVVSFLFFGFSLAISSTNLNLSTMSFYRSPVIPIHDATDLSISQFMTNYNPDDVPASKVVHTDTFSDDTVTYGSLRKQAGQAAWGLQRKLALQPGDALLALVNNSVRSTEQLILAISLIKLIEMIERLCSSRSCDMVGGCCLCVSPETMQMEEHAN